MSHPTVPAARPAWQAELRLLLAALAVLLLAGFLDRAALLLYNHELASGVPWLDLARAFFVGLRFDLAIACFLLLPAWLMLLLPARLRGRWLLWGWLVIALSLVLLPGIIEPEFYRQFRARLNNIAFQYLEADPATVTAMLWHGFPVVRLLAAWLLSLAAMLWLFVRLAPASGTFAGGRWWQRLLLFVLLLPALALGARGTARHGPPLRWGDAYHSQHAFANHLALNGLFTLTKAWTGRDKQQAADYWLRKVDVDAARARTRALLHEPGERDLHTPAYPLLRAVTPAKDLPGDRKPNVVVILMESFAARYTGVLGDKSLAITPHFDRLAQRGVLFERFFSNGTHTHQGMFATLACFPNLPGHEYLMQQAVGEQPFSGLPALLGPLGYQTLYLYNGDFSWDNQRGFFRNQGVERFIGRDDYRHPHFIDPTWGVADEDMFDRAARELAALPPDRPFLAILQTLSNHTPFALPDPLPVAPVTGQGHLNQHLTAMRYADWALGRFFARIESLPFYRNTLFVLLGDHGFPAPPQLTDIDLLRFRVPLLLLGPGLPDRPGHRQPVVGSQVDVVPTILGQLGRPVAHQCWGRDLLHLPPGDGGFAVIKPSGSEPTTALITADRILLDGPQTQPHSYALTWPAPPAPSPAIQPAARDEALLANLHAYVASGLAGLQQRRNGLPANVTALAKRR